MKDKRQNKDIIDQVRQSFKREVPDMLNHKLKAMLTGFRQDLGAHPYLRRHVKASPWRWRRALPPAWRRLALIAGTGAACMIVLLAVLLGNRTPSWAEVEKNIGDIAFCTVSVYHRYDPSGRPDFAQFWFGRHGRTRIHTGSSVVFIAPDTPVKVYDIKTRSKGYSAVVPKGFLRAYERARERGAPTMVSIIEALAGEGLVDTTDMLISDAQVARDLLVYDARSRDTLWRLRVWALRESMLPVRILKWHEKDGRRIELIFTYTQEQDADFFDAGVFSEALADPDMDKHRLKEMFFQVPGGRGISGPGE